MGLETKWSDKKWREAQALLLNVGGSKPSMVEIEKYFKIEIEIYRIEIFRTEIEIGFYRIGFLRFCFRFRYNFGISNNYDSIYFDTKFNRCYFDKYRIVSVL